MNVHLLFNCMFSQSKIQFSRNNSTITYNMSTVMEMYKDNLVISTFILFASPKFVREFFVRGSKDELHFMESWRHFVVILDEPVKKEVPVSYRKSTNRNNSVKYDSIPLWQTCLYKFIKVECLRSFGIQFRDDLLKFMGPEGKLLLLISQTKASQECPVSSRMPFRPNGI